jgi:hypothetical protein
MPRAHSATRQESVPTADITVLIDVDEASWKSWNRYASAFASDNHASVTNIDDGGIAGPAFFDHVARLGRPVLESPKRHAAPMPPTSTRRPVRLPIPLRWQRNGGRRPRLRADLPAALCRKADARRACPGILRLVAACARMRGCRRRAFAGVR